MFESELKNSRIAIIGLGNIGLPLAIEFGKQYSTIGFDTDTQRVEFLKKGIDSRDINRNKFLIPELLQFVSNIEDISNCNIYIVAVPTSVFPDGTPNIVLLQSVSAEIAKFLKKDDLVIYESTVFPGCTEGVCVPLLEKISGLKYNTDFFVGYSPERINTADDVHTLTNTIKITSGSDASTTKKVDELYQSIINAGTYSVASIKIAEASKLLENAQRDVNIAFMNNVATILSSNDIPFDEVWKASSTKWNFIPFSTGLVGGDCLPLASQYLNYGAKDKGETILGVSRKINDEFPQAIANLVIIQLKKTFPDVLTPQTLILGFSYKPNSSSIKGSLVQRLIIALEEYKLKPDVFDPVAEISDVSIISDIKKKKRYHLIILATYHNAFISFNYKEISYNKTILFDINSYSFKKI